MKTIRQICVCALLLASTGMAVCAIQLLRTATVTIAALPAEMAAVRQTAADQVQAARQDVLGRSERQMAAIRRDLIGQANEVREAADRRIGDSLQRVDTALALTDARIGQTVSLVEGLRSDFQPVLAGAMTIEAHADKAVVDLHPQLLGLVAASKVTAGETARTMRDVRGAVPGFLSQGQFIAGNVGTATERFSSVADNLNRLTKPKWYDRLLGYGLNGLVIYRSLNPVTSLTVKGAQILSSRP